MKKTSLFILMLIFFSNCISNKDDIKLSDNTFDKWQIKAQDLANKEKYYDSIIMLEEASKKFPDANKLTINYLIGFYYYKLKRYGDSKTYLNRVITIFDKSEFNQIEINENRKFVILSQIIIDKIDKNIEQLKDPYHIQEDIAKNKKIRSKK